MIGSASARVPSTEPHSPPAQLDMGVHSYLCLQGKEKEPLPSSEGSAGEEAAGGHPDLTLFLLSSPPVGDAQHVYLRSSDSHRLALQAPWAWVCNTTPQGCRAF